MPPSEVEQVEQALETAPTQKQDEQEAVEAILSGDLDAPERAEDAAPGGDTKADDESAEEVAEPEVAQGIDYAQEIPMADGSKATLGELKDAYQESQARLDAVQTRENEVNTKYQDVQLFMGLIQDHVPPEKLKAIEAEQKQYMEAQHRLVAEAVPEMATKAGFEKVKADMFALGKEYGVEHLVGKIDHHGFIKMMRDYAQLREGIRKAKDNVTPLRSVEPKAKDKPTGSAADQAKLVNQAKSNPSHQTEIAAINSLFK